jgi:acyl dehydratase
MSAMPTFVVSSDDNILFQQLSGDHNPIHWDVVAARRLMFGQIVIPGIHTVLRALDAWLAEAVPEEGAVFSVSRLSASLKAPLFIGEEARVSVRPRNDRQVLQVCLGDTVLAVVTVTGAWGRDKPLRAAPLRRQEVEPVLDLDADAIEGAFGSLPPHGDSALEKVLYPALFRHFGEGVATRLAAISRLVGCRCPGMHSLMVDFDLDLDAGSAGLPLSYRVTTMDRRFSLVTMEVSGHGLTGNVSAMLRPAVTGQQSTAALAVPGLAGRASGHRPLIVGGSRGLGEVVAKLIAAAGGEPVITYRSGEAEARAVKADIHAAGGQCHVATVDVLAAVEQWQAALPEGWRPNAVYYFATPRIFTRRTEVFSPALFRDYCAYYVEGFARACALLASLADGTASVFYPSSTALDEQVRGLPEYIMAKAAGEHLCHALAAERPGWRFVVRRLPRLNTDQTALIAPEIQLGGQKPADAAVVMAELLAEMLGCQAEGTAT